MPLFDMIRHWVFDGQLQDPACEFFIQHQGSRCSSSKDEQQGQALPGSGSAGSLGAERDLWREAYKLVPGNLPPFITQVLTAFVSMQSCTACCALAACNHMEKPPAGTGCMHVMHSLPALHALTPQHTITATMH